MVATKPSVLGRQRGFVWSILACGLDCGVTTGLVWASGSGFGAPGEHGTDDFWFGDSLLDLWAFAVLRCVLYLSLTYIIQTRKSRPISNGYSLLQDPTSHSTSGPHPTSHSTSGPEAHPTSKALFDSTSKALFDSNSPSNPLPGSINDSKGNHVISSLDVRGTEEEVVVESDREKQEERYTRAVSSYASYICVFASGLWLLGKGLHRLIKGVGDNPVGSEWFWPTCLAFMLCGIAQVYALTKQHNNPEIPTEARQHATWGAILSFCAPDWPLFLLAFTALTIAAAGQSSIPFLMGRLIDSIALDEDEDRFHRWMLILVVVACVTGIFTGIRGSTFTIVGARFSCRLRESLFRSLLSQEVAFFDTTKTGDITSRLSADTQKVGDQVELNVNVFLRSSLQAVFVLSFMMYINWKLALVAFVSVPSIVLASKVFGNYMRILSKSVQKKIADANGVADEALASIRTVKSFHAQREEAQRYAEQMRLFYIETKKMAWAYAFYAALTFTFLPYATSCLVLYYGGKLTRQNDLNSGELVSFVFYMQSLFAAFNSLGSIYAGLIQALGAADKVFEWINREAAINPPQDPIKPQACKGDIKMDQVSFRYPSRAEKVVLKDFKLHVHPGKVVALCGPSGSGKSSSIALLQGFYKPERGAITLDGYPILEVAPEWFHKNVALVGQEPVLFARSISDNICYGLLDDQRYACYIRNHPISPTTPTISTRRASRPFRPFRPSFSL
ncbi:hypothetical protein AAMO2058_000697400 [Amorphochlora amoebiformis]